MSHHVIVCIREMFRKTQICLYFKVIKKRKHLDKADLRSQVSFIVLVYVWLMTS